MLVIPFSNQLSQVLFTIWKKQLYKHSVYLAAASTLSVSITSLVPMSFLKPNRSAPSSSSLSSLACTLSIPVMTIDAQVRWSSHAVAFDFFLIIGIMMDCRKSVGHSLVVIYYLDISLSVLSWLSLPDIRAMKASVIICHRMFNDLSRRSYIL